MSWLPLAIQLAFAGVWAYLLHWGIGVALIVLFGAAGYFTTAVPFIGPYLTGARDHFYWAAACVAIFLGGHVVGSRDEAARCVAKAVVIEHTVDRVVEKVKKVPVWHWRTRPAADPYDSPKNFR